MYDVYTNVLVMLTQQSLFIDFPDVIKVDVLNTYRLCWEEGKRLGRLPRQPQRQGNLMPGSTS